VDSEQGKRRLSEAQVDALKQRLQPSQEAGAQTDLAGDEVGGNEAEIRKYKVMLEELQMKMKELVEKCKKRGLQEHVDEITVEMGLEEVFSVRAVFQRLFQDAQKRAERLERIREQLKIERGRTLEAAKASEKEMKPIRRLITDEAGEVPVMQAIEQSPLQGLQRIYEEAIQRDAADATNSSTPPPPAGGVPMRPTPPPVLARASEEPKDVLPLWVVTKLQARAARCGHPLREQPSQILPGYSSEVQDPSRRRRQDNAIANAAAAVERLQLQTSNSLPALPASRVAAQRLEAANGPLEAVFDRAEAKPKMESRKSIRRLLT